jgi:hypothetical protein
MQSISNVDFPDAPLRISNNDHLNATSTSHTSEAVISACSKENESDVCKFLVQHSVTGAGLIPFAISDSSNGEINALTCSGNLSRLLTYQSNTPVTFSRCLPDPATIVNDTHQQVNGIPLQHTVE